MHKKYQSINKTFTYYKHKEQCGFIVWATVTFRSVVINNLIQRGDSSVNMRSTSPPIVCLYTHIFGLGIRFDPNCKKIKIWEKNGKKIHVKFTFLTKLPDTLSLKATALCAVHALTV